MSNKGSFLKHIAGLRAIAIIFVVLFHLDGQLWTHGYLGVDVFLVITGYLLFCGEAKRAEQRGWRKPLGFLARRIGRLVPSMAVLILLTLGAGAFLLQTPDEIFASRVGYMALLAKANIFLAEEQANYFAADTEFNPLLHLWYLSVALQVYLLWAAGSFVMQRLPRRGIILTAGLAGLASLAYCYSFALHEWLVGMGLPVWEQSSAPSYYATLPRLWEVLAGGAALLLPAARRGWANAAAVLGLVMVVAPMLIGVIPGSEFAAQLPCALLAVAGSVLLIRYTPQSKAAALLENRVMLWLGGISFSVYLVHMPVIIYGKLWAFGEAGLWYCYALVAVALLLGHVYHWCIEKRRVALWVTLLLWVAALLFSRAGRKTEGFVNYIPLPTIHSEGYDHWQVCRDAELCSNWDSTINPDLEVFIFLRHKQPKTEAPLLVIGNGELRPSFVFMGDSHAMSLYAGMHEALKQEGDISGIYLGSIVLPFADYAYTLNSHYYYNPAKDAALHRWLAAHPGLSHVVISQHWLSRYHAVPNFEQRLRHFLQALQANGKKAVLLGSLPVYPTHNTLRYQKAAFLQGKSFREIAPTITLCEYARQNDEHMGILQRLQAEGLCTVIDLREALQPGEAFLGAQGDKAFILDTHHASPEGAIWLMQRLRSQLRAALTTRAGQDEPSRSDDE